MKSRQSQRDAAASMRRILDRLTAKRRLLQVATEAGARVGLVLVRGGGRTQDVSHNLGAEDRPAA